MRTSTITLFLASTFLLFQLTACQKDTSDNKEDIPETWAGSVSSIGLGDSGYINGHADTAKFTDPKSVAIDPAGNLYVADWGNHLIRKISTDNMVTTLAGDTARGYRDGVGTEAKFNSPTDLVTDAAGNVYVADQVNQRIRKITPDGTVTTLAGGDKGYADGVGTAAQFAKPRGITVDGSGNIYVADQENQRIRKITPDGTVTTLAGNGTPGSADGVGTAAQFNNPRDLTIDAAGNIYVADSENNRIRKITPDGTVTTLAGGSSGYADGRGTDARFRNPKGIVVDRQGFVYVADTDNHRIRRITPDGLVTTVAGDGTSGHIDAAGAASQLSYPRGLAISNDGKTLYLADQLNDCIRKITL